MKGHSNRAGMVFLLFIIAVLVFSATLSIGNSQYGAGVGMPFKADGKVNAVAMSPPPILEIYISGSGHASLMGNIIIEQHHFVDLTSMTFYDGTFAWTAADGSTIEGSYHGSLVPTSIGFEIHGYFTIDDGTGRFFGAEGGGTASGVQYFDNTGDLRLDGTIKVLGLLWHSPSPA